MSRTIAAGRKLSPVVASCLLAGATAACGGNPPLPESDLQVQVASATPPAISGGTLWIGGNVAIAADPDRDRVWIVDLFQRKLIGDVALTRGDEPGRVVGDGANRAHVALRGAGEVATIDLAAGQILRRTAVCPAPRGLAWDDATDSLHVACAGGELVTLDASTGEVLRKLRLASDLRDVVIDGDKLLVSVFRAAKVLVVGPDGTTTQEVQPSPMPSVFDSSQEFAPAVAWRMVGLATGGVAMVHQRAMTTGEVSIDTGGYAGGGCGSGVAHGTVSVIRPSGSGGLTTPPPAGILGGAILPVDVAVSSSGQSVAAVGAGSDLVFQAGIGAMETGFVDECSPHGGETVAGGPIAVAYDALDNLVVQTREPATLQILHVGTIELPGESVADTGHEMFHTNKNGASALACASCHPEGRDDGLVWTFSDIGKRRTQTLGGGVLQTAPLHWDGDMKGLDEIMSEVFVNRMGGDPATAGPRRVRAFGTWVDQIPVLPLSPIEDQDAVARGDALFRDPTVGCASCHSGEKLTNNQSADVGTGQAFQVPTLVGLASRAPYLHDGCAPTLAARFDPTCGGGDKHGKTSHLTGAQIGDLVAFLEAL